MDSVTIEEITGDTICVSSFTPAKHVWVTAHAVGETLEYDFTPAQARALASALNAAADAVEGGA